MGTSVEDNERLRQRGPALLKIPAPVRFLSIEPLLENLRFSSDDLRQWQWVIVGGESGPQARPCHVNWIWNLVNTCAQASVPCFVKQLGTNIISRNDIGFDGESEREFPMNTRTRDLDPMFYQGALVQVLLRHRKGGDPKEWPEGLRVQEFPKV